MRDVQAAAAKKDGGSGGAAVKTPGSAKKDMYSWNVTFTRPAVEGDGNAHKRATESIDVKMKYVTLGSDGGVIMMEGDRITTITGGVDEGSEPVPVNPDVPGNIRMYEDELARVGRVPDAKVVRTKAPSPDLKTEVAWCG